MSDAREDVGGDDEDVFERAESGGSQAVDGRWVPLPPSGMLTVEDADALLRWRDASLVAVVGERKGGKTTLVTEIYDRFLRGPFAGMVFTHSLSLLGFEKKSFESRAESGSELPDTPRTSAQDGLTFFHLALSTATEARRADLLISERAGEAYREVRDKPAAASALLEVRKSRVVSIVVDGERVAENRRRPEALASARDILRALADGGVIPATANVQIVTTKCDLLDGEDKAAARDALAEFEDRTIKTHKDSFSTVSAFRTAARDPSGKAEPARGLDALLRSWLEPPAAPASRPPALPALSDEFDRLLSRTLR